MLRHHRLSRLSSRRSGRSLSLQSKGWRKLELLLKFNQNFPIPRYPVQLPPPPKAYHLDLMTLLMLSTLLLVLMPPWKSTRRYAAHNPTQFIHSASR